MRLQDLRRPSMNEEVNMLFPTHNGLAAVQTLLRHLGIRRSAQSMAVWQVWLVLIAMSLAVTACGNELTTASAPDPTTASPPNPIIFFPQQEAVAGERASMEALLIGKLVVVEGCLRVNSRYSDTTYLLVWPPDFTLSTENDAIQILNGAGQVVARVGDEVRISGGETRSVEFLDERVRQKLPVDCPGPYWIVGDKVSPVEATEESAVPSVTQSAEAATPVPLKEEALVQDAQVYAADQGIDLDEAVRRLKLQGALGGLGAELATKERDTFAGLWIQHSPEFRIVVQFTRDGEETIRQYIENVPFADIVEVRTASVTLAELEAAQAAALVAVGDLGIPVESGLNVFENRVELYVTDRARFYAALREANIQLPDHAVVITVDELSTPEADINQ